MRLVRTNHFLLHSSPFIRILPVFTAISTAFLLQVISSAFADAFLLSPRAALPTAVDKRLFSHYEDCTIYGTLRCRWGSQRIKRELGARVPRARRNPPSECQRSSTEPRAVASPSGSGSKRCPIRMTRSESERTSKRSSSAGLSECLFADLWAAASMKSARVLRTTGLLGSCSTLTQRIEWCCYTVS